MITCNMIDPENDDLIGRISCNTFSLILQAVYERMLELKHPIEIWRVFPQTEEAEDRDEDPYDDVYLCTIINTKG